MDGGGLFVDEGVEERKGDTRTRVPRRRLSRDGALARIPVRARRLAQSLSQTQSGV